jgi:hypothetical protein
MSFNLKKSLNWVFVGDEGNISRVYVTTQGPTRQVEGSHAPEVNGFVLHPGQMVMQVNDDNLVDCQFEISRDLGA